MLGSVGENVVEGLDPAVYTLRVIPADGTETSRTITVTRANQCSVVLINDGITVDGRIVEAEFSGVGGADVFRCRVDRNSLMDCKF